LTTYRPVFLADAKKEWDRLGPTIRGQFGKKLQERLQSPHDPSARLSDLPDCDKIKLRAAGYRLVYRVDDGRVVVIVVAVGKRDRNIVYKKPAGCLNEA
jgi:mRNA interferase RelE/StbE